MKRLPSVAIFVLAGLLGLMAFAQPFLVSLANSAPGGSGTGPQPGSGPLLTTALIMLCLLVLLLEVQGQAVNAKVVAALGILVAIASVLRFLESAIPGPGGFSPVFVPIILAGYVYGARFGFLMGTMTLFTSAVITGGIGPWLPYQMYVAGWVGMTAGWLPHLDNRRAELALLALFGVGWGMLYGAALNLYFWPFFSGDAEMTWQPGSGLGNMLLRYGSFYLATSFVWDVARSAGNLIVILALGVPAVAALARFRERLRFEVA
jgi:energy-coupling factor transport system substrate-specific component